jgi:hypothetical protein
MQRTGYVDEKRKSTLVFDWGSAGLAVGFLRAAFGIFTGDFLLVGKELPVNG